MTFQFRPVVRPRAAAIALPVVVSRCTSADGVIARTIGRSAEPSLGVLAALGAAVPLPPHPAMMRIAASAHPSGPRRVPRMSPLLLVKASLSYAAELSFLAKLAARSEARDSILCVGLDPEPSLIPESFGRGPQAAVRFLRRIIRATADHVCAYKPNLAFYERYGSAAMDVLALTLQAIPADIPVILDAKRGDVPNTSAAYADALFDSFHADAATVAPYVGLDSIEPFTTGVRYALVLARTSNPGAGDFQDLEVAGRPLYERVVERCVERFSAERCGFVVGATYPDEARRLRAIAPDRLFLMPGIGSQGGDVSIALRAGMDANGGGVLPSASRSVLYASRGDDFEKAAGEAARMLREAANAARAAATAGSR